MEATIATTTNINSNLTKIHDFLDRNYNTVHIKESLLELPAAIAAQKAKVRRIRDAFREADLPRQMLELEMIDDIAAAINPQTGKPLFSNDKLRDAELKRRKAASEEYQELQKQAKEAERDLSAAEDELEKLINKFNAYQHVSNFVAAEMNVVAALMKVAGADTDDSVKFDDSVRFWPTEKAMGESKETNGQPF